MPVLLTTDDEFDAWLNAPTEEVLNLQRPLPEGVLQVVPEASEWMLLS